MKVEIVKGGETVADLGQTPTMRGAVHLIMTWARKHTPYSCKGYVRMILGPEYTSVDYGDYTHFGRVWK